MGKYKEAPRYNIVSVRVTDDEYEELHTISSAHNKRISDLLRDALLATLEFQNETNRK